MRVALDSEGAPRRVEGELVLHVAGWYREWIGALEGEPERDVWRVETGSGLMELHHLHEPAESLIPADPGVWLLARWED